MVFTTAIMLAVIITMFGYAYVVLKPPSPRKCPNFSKSPRVRLSDGRFLAYKERGVPMDKAHHKIILSHAFGDNKHFPFPISQDILEDIGIYILSFDRAGYGESDPNPKRSVKSEAFDIQELADILKLGPKFYVIGISVGAYPVYACLKYIPHRLSGAALIVPLANYWWRCFPANVSGKAFNGLLFQDRLTFWIAHHAPWLLYWWMTQKWLPSLSAYQGKTDGYAGSDVENLKQLATEKQDHLEQSKDEQNVHESLFRDLIIGFGKWDFDPTDILNPFPNEENRLHIWQGYEDKLFPKEMNRYISERVPWIKYHEVGDAGHFLIYKATHCEAMFRALVSP